MLSWLESGSCKWLWVESCEEEEKDFYEFIPREDGHDQNVNSPRRIEVGEWKKGATDQDRRMTDLDRGRGGRQSLVSA